MKTRLLLFLLTLAMLNTFAQSKKELKEQVENLKNEKTELETKLNNIGTEKENLKTKLDRISDIDIDDVITPDEQPTSIVIGESGWRVELNGLKYKNDLIGQLGTIWILDTNGQIQPQGGFKISDFSIEPKLLSEDKEVIYKKFISRGTSLQGDGGTAFINIAADLSNDQYSNFSINIEGTSQIIPGPEDFPDMANKVKYLFEIPSSKGIFICTGMHVIRYHSVVFSKSDGNMKITSPVVNIGGNFYAESSEESSEYLVVRQLTQLYKPSKKKEKKVEKKLELISLTTDSIKARNKAEKYSAQEILKYFLNREPTFEEKLSFESNPEKFFSLINIENDSLSIGNKQIIESAKMQIITLPVELNQIEDNK